MEKAELAYQAESKRMVPTGGVVLDQERLNGLASAWEGNYRSLRAMDTMSLGEIEPATLFVWNGEER